MEMLRVGLVVLTALLALCESYKILLIYQIPTGSHYILASKMAKDLAGKGHQVTFITPYPAKTPIKNIKEIVVESLQHTLQGSHPSAFKREHTTPLEQAKFIMEIQCNLTENLLQSTKIQGLYSEKFDAVLLYQYMNDALLPMAHHFKVPVILFSSMPLYSSESFLLGHPTSPSYVPNILTGYTGRMSFWQRLRNTYYDTLIILYYNWFVLPKQQQIAQKYVPNNLDVYDVLNNASLILINSNPSTNEAIPLVPNAIEIGGFHIEEPKPLPSDVQRFLDESPNGVILFSMGSISQSVGFPKEKRDEILKAFSKLKQNILWKFEDEKIEDLPRNVKTMKWVPQSDVLAHPNVKLFISHGGLLSLMESVNRGVPVVGIPLYTDQKMNMALATANQWAQRVPYQELTEDNLLKAINEVLTNPKYKENVVKRSKIMKDQLLQPNEMVPYWVEYVIRHHGASHLRCPGADLTWYQRQLLDIVALVLAIFVTTVIFVKRLTTKSQKVKIN